MNVSFKSIEKSDLAEVTAIYNYYVENSTATFHLQAVTEQEMEQTLCLGHPVYQSFVILSDDKIAGFCYLGQFRKKEAYDISVEVTLYIKPAFTGKQIGVEVLSFMEKTAKNLGLKNLIGVITSENVGSLKLFERCGYFKCGHLKNIGIKFGRALDVISYQKEI
ncbi:MAG: GNAT family N-acetyltransferase [Vicingaceae bacterium]|jgi:L-amino acid N-acyltransferase YncA|nr:N-acetyltransferase [Flavobacteriales bacterium]MBQ21729.1 GNAT family N-acetyltransferase [Flavobacteriales bacterium]MDF1675026.1 GNAT family N-acetyltransferase [Vicingaceae bacterium]|tara:strand:+ start:38272 stop:38763 length:492 start_codon:yes stop_codon:yes gene_type:complete